MIEHRWTDGHGVAHSAYQCGTCQQWFDSPSVHMPGDFVTCTDQHPVSPELLAAIQERRADETFMNRLRANMKKHARLLKRLSGPGEPKEGEQKP